MKKLLEFIDIKKSYKSLKVLEDTTFSVGSNEIVCLLGPSGSGKTTLFNLAAGLIEPDQGTVEINQDIRRGYVFQETRLLPWKTVAANLKFVQKNYLPSKEARVIRDSLLELTGLGKFKESYPAQLSGGMKQRVEIVRALAIQPDLLLVDEPFKSVDTQTRVNLQQMLLRFWEYNQLSLLLITHDPEVAVLLASRIYVLSQKPGKIIREFKIDKPQHKRQIRDKELYQIIEEITNLFMDLVGEYRWHKDENTAKLIGKLSK